MIHTKYLLWLSLPIIFLTYYIFLPGIKIFTIIFDEKWSFLFVLISFVIYLYLKNKLKDKDIFELIPNLNLVHIKQALGLFLLFSFIDYYFEDGFIGMISLWLMYWLFAVGIYLLMNAFNLYKNLQVYKITKKL